MTPYETRLLELVEKLEEDLAELRRHLDSNAKPAAAHAQAMQAFADEALKARDA